MMNFALLGNPNTGKTSLFNNLTGSYEYVGNWSGVTVEKKVGTLKNKVGQLIDLPGIYTLSPLSKDEGVVSNFFINETFDGIVNIIDASQLERNLILTIQLLEFGKPMVIGLNMIDVAKNRGIQVNEEKLSKALNVAVMPIIARTGDGCSLLNNQISIMKTMQQKPLFIDYGQALEQGMDRLINLIPPQLVNHLPHRWLSLQFFEGNQNVHEYLATIIPTADLKLIFEEIEHAVRQITM